MQPRDDLTVLHEPEELSAPPNHKLLWVCGGAEIYNMLLAKCSQLIISHVHGSFAGDTFFPKFSHLFKYDSDIYLCDKFVTKVYNNVNCNEPMMKFVLD